MQQFFCFVDHLQRSYIDPGTVSNTRGETGHGGFVPYRYTQHTGNSPYLAFAQFCLFKRATNMKFTRRPLPRAKIAIIVFIDTIADVTKIRLFRHWLQLSKEFIFTKVAAIEVIGSVAFVFEFVCFKCQQWQAHLLSSSNCFGSLFRSVGRRRGNDPDGTVAQDVVCYL